MKKTKKALRLDKETIRNLDPGDAARVAGGVGSLYCSVLCTNACPTQVHCVTPGCPQ